MITRSQSHRHDDPSINTIDIPDQENTSITTTDNDETTKPAVPLPTRYSRRLLLSRTLLSPNTSAFYPTRQHLLSAQAIPFYPPTISYDDTELYTHNLHTQPTIELCHHCDTGNIPLYPPAISYDNIAFCTHHQHTQPTTELCLHRDTGSNNGNDFLPNQFEYYTNILFNTRHFYPPHPQGTYYENGLLRSLNIMPPDTTPDTQQQQSIAISTRQAKDFPYHGNHCFITQNVNGMMYDDLKIKSYIHQMKTNNWSAVCLQETWKLGTNSYFIDGYKILEHGHSTNMHTDGRTKAGVCIILNPFLADAHQMAQDISITLPIDHEFEGHFLGIPLTFRDHDNNGKKLKRNTTLFLCSVYHPYESHNHAKFNDLLPTLISQAPSRSHVILGHDINCNVGICDNPNDDDLRQAIGPFGLDNRNEKGLDFIQTLLKMELKVANSYFRKRNHATYRNINGNSHHMLDVFSTSTSIFKRIKDCGIINGGITSDHTAVKLTIQLSTIQWKSSTRDDINTGETDWTAIMTNPYLNQQFNNSLSNHLQPNPTYTTFFSSVHDTGRATATKLPIPPVDWFEFSRDGLQPVLDKVIALLLELRDPSNATPSHTKTKLALANRIRNIRVREAKMDFNRHMANKLNNAAKTYNSKEIHKIIKATSLGNEINHSTKRPISLRLPNGERAINDSENMSVLLPHCQRIFNNHKAVSPQALLHMKQRPILQSLDDDFSDAEIRTALRQMKNNKAPGSNGIPIEALKAMNDTNFEIVREYLRKFWNGEVDYDEWHSGTGTPIPKTINPDDPNKFRIINLMDVSSKLFSKIMTARAQSLMAKHGTTYQFGATPDVGCQDGSFVLHTATHLRHQHNLETYVVFADLVKAYDTSNHKLIAEILTKLGAPPKFRDAINRLYTDLTVTLKIGKEKATVAQTVGVRQGDNLSPVIFLMIMTAFSEILDATWTHANIPKPQFHRGDMTNIQAGAKLTGHNIKRDYRTSSSFKTYHILYLDDGSFIFQNRDDLVNGLEIINNIFETMGLEMHVGKGETKSKTEAMYFPTSAFFKQPTPATIMNSTEPCDIISNPADDTHDREGNNIGGRTTYSKLSQKQREVMYHASPNTNRVYMQDEISYIDFTTHFKYLGTYISFDLSADYDINNRITKASREMGRLCHFFNNQYVELNFKHQVFLQYIVNVLLWGCESWAIRDYHFRQLNSFIHRSIRRILHIRMSQVIDDHVKNTSIRKTFFNLPTAEDLIAIRSMTYMGKLARGPMSNPAKQFLTAFVNNPRPIGGVIMTNKKSMVKHLNHLLPHLLPTETIAIDQPQE